MNPCPYLSPYHGKMPIRVNALGFDLCVLYYRRPYVVSKNRGKKVNSCLHISSQWATSIPSCCCLCPAAGFLSSIVFFQGNDIVYRLSKHLCVKGQAHEMDWDFLIRKDRFRPELELRLVLHTYSLCYSDVTEQLNIILSLKCETRLD
jgi:hypothetical protein